MNVRSTSWVQIEARKCTPPKVAIGEGQRCQATSPRTHSPPGLPRPIFFGEGEALFRQTQESQTTELVSGSPRPVTKNSPHYSFNQHTKACRGVHVIRVHTCTHVHLCITATSIRQAGPPIWKEGQMKDVFPGLCGPGINPFAFAQVLLSAAPSPSQSTWGRNQTGRIQAPHLDPLISPLGPWPSIKCPKCQ